VGSTAELLRQSTVTESFMNTLKSYTVWDKATRLFHWINFICILGLITLGIAILNTKVLGVSSDGKVLLKIIHVYIGYLFVANLLWRIIWGFVGNRYARWKAVLPFRKGYLQSLKAYVTSVKSGETQQYLGHNPLARLMVALLFLLLTIQAVTGLVLAGTDVYMPPFGDNIAEWVAEKDQQGNPVSIEAGSKVGVNPEAYAEMRSFRKLFIITHYYSFYLLLVTVVVHISFVVITEIKEKNGLISAMITGKKVSSKKPIDH